MSEEHGHNGFDNYSTWLVNLHINNTPQLYHYWRAQAAGAENVVDFADQLEAEFEEGAPEIKSKVYADLLTHALSVVNWYEIAKFIFNEVHRGER